MTTLANALSKAISTNLLSNLPNALSEQFGVESEELKTFLNEFLSNQLPNKGKSSAARTPSPKGADGKGRISGFIMFSSSKRDEVIKQAQDEGQVFYKQKKVGKDAAGKPVYEDAVDENGERIALEKMPVGQCGKRLGELWKQLSDAQRAQWNAKAEAHNAENGLPAGKKSSKAAATSKAPAAAKAAPAKTKPIAKASAVPAATAPATGELPKVTRHLDTKSWLFQGTDYVVKSPKNKIVIGKLVGNKVLPLDDAALEECEANGWETGTN